MKKGNTATITNYYIVSVGDEILCQVWDKKQAQTIASANNASVACFKMINTNGTWKKL